MAQSLRVLEIVSSIEVLVTVMVPILASCCQEHIGEVAIAFQVVLHCFPAVRRQALVLAPQFE